MQLTVVVLAKNEEERLPRAIQSLKSLSCRLVVVDSGSTDSTLAVAQKTWAELEKDPKDLILVSRSWLGFTAMRNDSLRWVTTPWVLWLDSDEAVSHDLAQELKSLETVSEKVDVVEMPRLSWFLGRWIRHSGWYPDKKKRLARTAFAQWTSSASDVHEDLSSTRAGDVAAFGGHLCHWPFRGREEQNETNLRYAKLLAEGIAKERLSKRKGPPSVFAAVIRTGWKFFENYILKLGILDGVPGFIICLGSARGMWHRYKTIRHRMISAQESDKRSPS